MVRIAHHSPASLVRISHHTMERKRQRISLPSRETGPQRKKIRVQFYSLKLYRDIIKGNESICKNVLEGWKRYTLLSFARGHKLFYGL